MKNLFIKWYRQYDFMYITSKNNEKIFQGDYIYDKTMNKDEWIVPTHFMNFMYIFQTKNKNQ